MASKHVVVDGSNIATEGRALPSLTQLDEAVRAFLDERPHETCIVVVDATFEHRIEPSEKRMYDEAVAAGELITPPAGTIGRGDKFLLEIADRAAATVFSNDSFQEFHGEYDWLFEPGRLIGGKPVPGIGWIFTERTPVRGARSRMATRAATKKRPAAAPRSAAKRAAKSGPAATAGPPPVPTKPPPKAPTARSSRSSAAADAGAAPRRRSGRAVEPVNAALPFIEFITEHLVGDVVMGEVVGFASHGAYVMVGDVRCYLALRHLSKPPPRSARDVLKRGEVRDFVVQALDAPRRGIDLALPGFEGAEESTETATAEGPTSGATLADQAPVETGAEQPESEATLATTPAKKTAAKKAAATRKKTTATRKTAAKKAAATRKKTTATRKTAAKKAAATRKKTTATRKTAGKKATATRKKATATRKKATATRKTAAKKAPAKKKKAAAKKAPAKKKAAAKKATKRSS